MSEHVLPETPAPGLPAGRMGMWWFLAGETVIFGGLIACYILLRLHHPEWAEHAAHASWVLGGTNTLVLLTSSWSIVKAYQAITEDRADRALRLMGLTIGLGFVFLGIKAVEYTTEITAGYTITANLFWSFYFVLTGLHALHVIGGLVAIGIVMLGVRRRQNLQRVEYVGLYWHLVDIVWIFLFPLLYIAS